MLFWFQGGNVIKGESKWVKIVLLILLCIYITLCGTYFVFHGNEGIRGSFENFDNDDVKYLRSAWTLLENGRFTYKDPNADTVFIMPGITVVLAAFVAVFGKYPILQFKIFQALLGAACLYMIFLSGKKLFSTGAALIATGLMAFYAPSIYITGTLLTEVCFYFLFLLTFYHTINALQTKRMKYYIIGGIFLGFSVLFRPPVVLALPMAVLFVWIIKKYKFMEMLKFGSAVVGVVIVILSPWIIRNAVLFKEFIPLTKSSGNPAFQGTFINYDRSVEQSENIDYYDIIKRQIDIDVDKYGSDEIVDNAVESQMTRIRFDRVIKKQPIKYLHWYTVGKTIMNFKNPFLWVVLFNISVEKLNKQHFLLLISGIVGLILLFITGKKNRDGVKLFPAFCVLFFNISYLPFYCFPRYMFPIIFCFALYGAYFLNKTVFWCVRSMKKGVIRLFGTTC
ncbi:MAG: glycosyltransferase family 39 protein [Clostridiaceae bacterium]|nr:glycosyltransferase family 39 protein [Clostridiaceae bacterium]